MAVQVFQFFSNTLIFIIEKAHALTCSYYSQFSATKINNTPHARFAEGDGISRVKATAPPSNIPVVSLDGGGYIMIVPAQGCGVLFQINYKFSFTKCALCYSYVKQI